MTLSLKPEKRMAAFEEACREKGLRRTPQRLEIFRELAFSGDHPTAETLYQRLRGRMPGLSLDTVYRTLGTLARHGLIHRVDTAESQARYEVADTQHHHLICDRCGSISDFAWVETDAAALPSEVEAWGSAHRKVVVVYGTCRACLQR